MTANICSTNLPGAALSLLTATAKYKAAEQRCLDAERNGGLADETEFEQASDESCGPNSG